MDDSKFITRLKRLPRKPRQKIGCLIWTGGCYKDRYGNKSYGHVTRTALRPTPILTHHLTWFYATGEWPKDKLLHRCDTPLCCEITHLFEGSQGDNMRDKVLKGRRGNTIRYPEELVEQVRKAKGSTHEIGRRFGMSQTNVWSIRNNKTRLGTS